jgi:hypothetical protein
MVLVGWAWTLSAAATTAGAAPSGVVCERTSDRALPAANERTLTESLRRITGLASLHFREDGALDLGDASEGGASSARALLERVLRAGVSYRIEDHTASETVRFGQLDEGTQVADPRGGHRLVWRVRLDFRDFEQLDAADEVRRAFDPGFVLLHELLHGLGMGDTTQPQGLGEVEEALNVVRTELGLPVRLQYLGTARPLAREVYSVSLRFRAGRRTRSASFLMDRRSVDAALAARGEAVVKARPGAP